VAFFQAAAMLRVSWMIFEGPAQHTRSRSFGAAVAMDRPDAAQSATATVSWPHDPDLRRPKLAGLKRNAAVVLGNVCADQTGQRHGIGCGRDKKGARPAN
jgi:hypothetical protein